MLRSRGSHRAPPRPGLAVLGAHALAVLGFGSIAAGAVASALGAVAGFLGAAAVVVVYASCAAVARVFAQQPPDDEAPEDEEPVSAVPWIAPFVMQMPVPVVPRWSTVYYAPRQIAQGDGAELVEEGLTTLVLEAEPVGVVEAAVEPDLEFVAEYSPGEMAAYAAGFLDCQEEQRRKAGSPPPEVLDED